MNTITNSSEIHIPPNQTRRLFWLLICMVAFGLIALVPYGLTLTGQSLTGTDLPQRCLQYFSQILLYSILIRVGLKLGQPTGLGAPVLADWLYGEKSPAIKWFGMILLAGLAAGLGIILVDRTIFSPHLAEQLQITKPITPPSAWQGFLASFYGGIVEEVTMRLFLLTLLAWLGNKFLRSKNDRPASPVMWTAIIVSGMVFSIAHLPTAMGMGISLTPLFVTRTLVLNSIGILYGWLYWKYGLGSAMLAHFGSDIAVHVIGAFLV